MTTPARTAALNGEVCRMAGISNQQFVSGLAAGVILARALIDRDPEVFAGFADYFEDLAEVDGQGEAVQRLASHLIRVWDMAAG